MPVIKYNRPNFTFFAGMTLSPAKEGTYVTPAQLAKLKANSKFAAALEVPGLLTVLEDAKAEKVAKDAGSLAKELPAKAPGQAALEGATAKPAEETTEEPAKAPTEAPKTPATQPAAAGKAAPAKAATAPAGKPTPAAPKG